MILLVSGATTTVQRYYGHPHLGKLLTPDNGNSVHQLVDWVCAADNAALGKDGVTPDLLIWMWDRLKLIRPPHLKFVAAPDAVMMTPEGPLGDWNGTLWLWRCWRSALLSRQLPAAIVLQDGATVETIPWDDLAAIFIGGSTVWKEGKEVEGLIAEAKQRDKWVHVGRINSLKRLRHFEACHADSFDGTQFSRFGNTYIPRYLSHLSYKQETFV